MRELQFSDLVGETIAHIDGGEIGSDIVSFHTLSGKIFQLRHLQDCCESVRVEDVAGNLADLIGSPVLLAEEVSSNDEGFDVFPADIEYGANMSGESRTWTFYKLATIKGYVTFRWLGESSGYYSESVDCIVIGAKEKSSQ